MGMVLSACSDPASDHPFDENNFPQKWELTGMSGSIPGFLLEGDNLLWKETIALNFEKTFIKIREIDGAESEATGSFFTKNQTDKISWFWNITRKQTLSKAVPEKKSPKNYSCQTPPL